MEEGAGVDDNSIAIYQYRQLENAAEAENCEKSFFTSALGYIGETTEYNAIPTVEATADEFVEAIKTGRIFFLYSERGFPTDVKAFGDALADSPSELIRGQNDSEEELFDGLLFSETLGQFAKIAEFCSSTDAF